MEVIDWSLGGFELIIIAAVLLFFVGWIAALISILKNNFSGQYDKLIWIILVVFIPLIGTILYFAIGRNKRIKNNQVSNGIV